LEREPFLLDGRFLFSWIFVVGKPFANPTFKGISIDEAFIAAGGFGKHIVILTKIR
jgi:hypothetical protein